MTIIERIKYNRDDSENETRLLVISVTVVLGFFLIVLTMKFLLLLLTIGIIGIEIKLLSEKDGILEIYIERGEYYLKQIEKKGLITNIEKIKRQEFSWNYYHMGGQIKGGTTKQLTHVNFTQIKYEIMLESGRELKILRELNQWESVKSDWSYKLLLENKESELLITTNKLENLKRIIEGNAPNKA
ncbi:MAG: hypothetical protein R2828_34160 [Saprospiraceae bacterium]